MDVVSFELKFPYLFASFHSMICRIVIFVMINYNNIIICKCTVPEDDRQFITDGILKNKLDHML
ncbi:hypothetical protein AMS66_24790 [Paenibacillus xylanivorans]|uniref:Uncharacterized protein n=1 Tax=Paenibacillus xylanivorans TaxID=1705561 RepID=A0A0M9BL37_9BACL|nr:hypothetical protein AMS66_24790 [Paenibacillus xylanivorans]